MSDEQITAQLHYCLHRGWAVSVEYTDDPHPRNAYWEMWGLPLFDLEDPAGILLKINSCRKTFPNHYIKVNGFDRTYRRQTMGLSFIVNRPQQEPGFRLERQEGPDRMVRYTVHSYATDRPAGSRYDA